MYFYVINSIIDNVNYIMNNLINNCIGLLLPDRPYIIIFKNRFYMNYKK